MRKLNLLMLLSLSCLFAAAQDQAKISPSYRNIIKIEPIRFFSSTFQVSYERLIGNDKSFNLSAGLIYKDSDYERVDGFRGEFQFRYFVLQHVTPIASRKLYFAPFVFDQYADVTNSNYYIQVNPGGGVEDTRTYNVNSFGGGVVIGINLIFAKRFVVDAFVGGGVRTSNMVNDPANYIGSGLFDYGYKGIFPRVGLDLGFTF